ncbi:hypothetical protein AXZ77_2518 [Thioclava sp. ES.031]|nr:hypothetical protein AXZ77_2518 [Thioclava sp. ES.031]
MNAAESVKPCYGDGNRGLKLEVAAKRSEAKARKGGDTQDGSDRRKHS